MPIAVCTFPIPPLGSASQGLPLLPLGSFRAADGRPMDVPAWVLTPERAKAIAARIAADPRKRPIDYEHQTLLSEKNGQPAPAAGWWHQLDTSDSHLVATDVEWTARAKGMIDAAEYRYLSPVFSYHPKTGEVTNILHAGLTNTPALANLGEIQVAAARAFPIMELPRHMKPETLALLALQASAGEDEIHAAIAKLTAKISDSEQHLAALKTPDPAQWVPIVVANDLRSQLAAECQALADLRAQAEEADKAALIEDARNDGRLLGDELLAYAKAQSLDGLKTLLAALKPIAALKGKQTDGKQPPAESPTSVDPVDAEGFKAACKTQWDSNAALRTEFRKFETYHAFKRAEAEGRVRIKGSKSA